MEEISLKGLLAAFGSIVAVAAIVGVFGVVLHWIGAGNIPYDPCNQYLQYSTLQQIKDCGL